MTHNEAMVMVIKSIRGRNNENWMSLLKVALDFAPKQCLPILESIIAHDKQVIEVFEKLAKELREKLEEKKCV